MRVTTAFNRVLDLPGASVVGVDFTDQGIVIGLRRRARLHRCPCGRRIVGRYDRSRRRWRHLDMGVTKVWLEYEITRVWCPACGRVRTEDVPWARPGARHSRDFEDVVAWLARHMDKTAVSRLMRCSWEAAHNIVTNVVAEHLDPQRLEGLYRIGIDEISYKRGHRYLTVVADHDSGEVVWVGTGRSTETLEKFYAELGPDRADQLEAVTMDGSSIYRSVTQNRAKNAAICLDPFHIMKWTNQALDDVFRTSAMTALKDQLKRATRSNNGWRAARYAFRAGKEKLRPEHQEIIDLIRREREDLHVAWLLKEELRDLFAIIEPEYAAAYLRAWITRVSQSGIKPMVNLALKLHGYYDLIVAGLERRLSNGRLEGINTKIRVIQRRGYGHPNPAALTSMIYLCCSGMRIVLPTER